MIHINHLAKRFGRSIAVDDVSIRIQPGESVALWGANGAGKTTIIRCLTGLYRYEGAIQVNGCDAVRHGKQVRQQIGYVPQELGFYDDLRISAAIEFFATLRGVSTTSTDAILARVQLDGHARKRMRELSGGMKQRLALAIALIGDPPVLVLDEVTASLDATGRREFVSLLANLAQADGRCVLFASHRLEEIEALASRVILLDRGRVADDVDVYAFASRIKGPATLHLAPANDFESAAFPLIERQA